MNLDLGILWIEDSYSTEEEEKLRRRIQDAGFIARIKPIPNGTDIEKIAHKHNLYHSFDIILLDYRLGNENGDELAPKIRELFPSTTILFYSSTVGEPELRRLIAEKQVEGVYCCDRLRFIERAGALIDQTAYTLDRLSGMRGLAMRVVADCDAIIKEAILSMCERNPNCSEKVTDLDDDVIRSLEESKKTYQEAAKINLNSRLTTRAVDSAKLFKHFNRLTKIATRNPIDFGLNNDQVDRLRELRRISAQYIEVVLKKRNILGHVAEIKGKNGWTLEGEGSNEIRVEDFPEIRRIFAAHIDAFREMKTLVSPLDEQQSS